MVNAFSGSVKSDSGFMPAFTKVIKSIVVSYIVSLVLIVALSALVCYTDVPEVISSPGVKVITFLGVFVSAFLSAANANGKGWLVGGITGICNIAVLIAISLFFVKAPILTFSSCVELLCGFVFGALGGIVGINFSES